MTEPMQITTDGREERHEDVANGRNALRLSVAQKAILDEMRLRSGGVIRSSEAGKIVHRIRYERHGYGGYEAHVRAYATGLGCCKWSSSDGSSAMRPLLRFGLVERVKRGVYELSSKHDERGVQHG